ncbi:hypothetical protein DRQ32_00900 [bacterium]|nr:MAG: hypothetical protein DRQ32_00900 [bacterium]
MAELIWSVDGDLAGELNMAHDRAMWRAFEADPSPGVRLRVYGWSPPALSLGFHQDQSAVDLQELEARGYSLVRRPTGGAAVLHVDEITYAVAAPLGLVGLGRAVQEIHDNIAGSLLELFAGIGLGVELGGAGPPRDFACFSAAGGHEMTVAGRKLVGSALRRGRRAFLQHGSILCGDGHLELGSFMAGRQRGARPGAAAARAADLYPEVAERRTGSGGLCRAAGRSAGRACRHARTASTGCPDQAWC